MNMKLQNKSALLLSIILIVTIGVLASFYLRETKEIIDIHESVENSDEAKKLTSVMFWTGIDKMVLEGIPYEMLHFTGNTLTTYSKLDENNKLISEIADSDPTKFSYFCGVNPNDFDALDKIESCMKEGALGIKIYDGYKAYHTLALDNSTML